MRGSDGHTLLFTFSTKLWVRSCSFYIFSIQAVNKHMCGSSSAVRFELIQAPSAKTHQPLQTEQAPVWLLACERRMQKKKQKKKAAAAAFLLHVSESLASWAEPDQDAACSELLGPAALTWPDWLAHRCCQMFVYFPWWHRARWPPPIDTQILSKIQTFLFFPPLISCRCAGTSTRQLCMSSATLDITKITALSIQYFHFKKKIQRGKIKTGNTF